MCISRHVRTQQDRDNTHMVRLLCLHAFRSSGKIMEMQLLDASNLADAFGGNAEFDFLDGARQCTPEDEAELDANTRAFLPPPYFEWASANVVYGTVIYSHVDDSLQKLAEHIRAHGPYDGLVGFSQGGMLAHLYCLLAARGEPGYTLPKLLVLMSCSASRHHAHAELLEQKLAVPTLAFYAEHDPHVPADETRALLRTLSDVTAVVDEEGRTHRPPYIRPADMPRVRALVNRVLPDEATGGVADGVAPTPPAQLSAAAAQALAKHAAPRYPEGPNMASIPSPKLSAAEAPPPRRQRPHLRPHQRRRRRGSHHRVAARRSRRPPPRHPPPPRLPPHRPGLRPRRRSRRRRRSHPRGRRPRLGRASRPLSGEGARAGACARARTGGAAGARARARSSCRRRSGPSSAALSVGHPSLSGCNAALPGPGNQRAAPYGGSCACARARANAVTRCTVPGRLPTGKASAQVPRARRRRLAPPRRRS